MVSLPGFRTHGWPRWVTARICAAEPEHPVRATGATQNRRRPYPLAQGGGRLKRVASHHLYARRTRDLAHTRRHTSASHDASA